MRPPLWYLTAEANAFPARPQAVSSLALMDRLNSGLCWAETDAGNSANAAMRRSARTVVMARSLGTLPIGVSTCPILVRQSHSITSSARAKSVGGIVRLSDRSPSTSSGNCPNGQLRRSSSPQGLVEHAAALDEQVRSIAGLEPSDSLGGIADQALAVVPRQRPVGRCHNMLSNGVERLADRLAAVVGPVCGEDLVGSPAKQQLIAAAQQPPHRLAPRSPAKGANPPAQ